MNNKAYDTALELVQYFSTVRAVGHTTAMLKGVGANDIIVAHNQEWADSLSKKTDATCVSLGSIPNGALRSNKKPLVLDNAATMMLLSELVSQIAMLRSEVKDLREANAKHRMTIAMVKKIISE